MTLEEATKFLANAGHDPQINQGPTGEYLRVGAVRTELSDAIVAYGYMIWIRPDQNQWIVDDLPQNECTNYSTLSEATLAADRLLRKKMTNKGKEF